MSHSLRWAVCAALLALGFVGACLTFSIHWEGHETPDSVATVLAEFDRGADLERLLGEAHAREQAQDLIGHALIAGKIDLAEAVRRFDELPGRPDQFRALLREGFPGTTDRERLGHLVIRWACGLLRDEPDRAAALRQRWLAELPRLGNPGRP